MADNTDILTAVETYFDALHHCDTEKLGAVFHPASSLFDADNGTIFVDPISSYTNDVANRPSPASLGYQKEAEILMLDYLCPISATLKVRIRLGKNVFIDHLGFIKGENGWQIVSKIWHLERVIAE